MSKIERLIKELCPDGVEYKEMGEIGLFYGGLSGKSKEDFKNGNAKYISYMNVFSNLAIKTNIIDFVNIEKEETQKTVSIGDVLFTGSSETRDECGMSSVLTDGTNEPLYLNSFCFGFRLNNPILMAGFSKYLFRSENIRKQIIMTASGVTRFNVSKEKMKKITIPIPPIPVQEEIVRILDKFTQLEAELEAELEARKKQYECYRDLLVGTPFIVSDDKYNIVELGEICSISVGEAPSKNDIGYYPFINAGTSPSGYFDCFNTEPDTITTPSRGQGGIGYVAYQTMNFWCGPLSYRIRSIDKRVATRYLYHYMSNNSNNIIALANMTGVPALNRKELIRLQVPIPSLTVQLKIVNVLDKFDKITNDISIGLPAEIIARRKQYEYYRDRLLSFKEK